MADAGPPPRLEVLLPADAVQAAVRATAELIAPSLCEDTVAVCLLTGGLWFAADLMRTLAALDRHPLFDALWLASYGDARMSAGEVEVRAGLQRPVAGRDVLILDDVLESGLSLAAASRVAGGGGGPLGADGGVRPQALARRAPPGSGLRGLGSAGAVPGRLRHGPRRPVPRAGRSGGPGLSPASPSPHGRRRRCSGNSLASAASSAVQTPRSVMIPLTSRAGVTSKA